MALAPVRTVVWFLGALLLRILTRLSCPEGHNRQLGYRAEWHDHYPDGLSFAVWARVHLGKYWSSMPAIKMDHKLIRTGPYNLVRHPIYTGILFGIAGTAIIIGEPLGLIAFILILVVYLWKIRMEEKYLQEEFGEDYVRYKKEVPALIPLLV